MLPELDRYLTRERDDRDDGPDPHRQDEERREKLWAEFVAFCRDCLRRHDLSSLLGLCLVAFSYADEPSHLTESSLRIANFAASEGWPATLHAIARAMAEQEAAEIERRR